MTILNEFYEFWFAEDDKSVFIFDLTQKEEQCNQQGKSFLKYFLEAIMQYHQGN